MLLRQITPFKFLCFSLFVILCECRHRRRRHCDQTYYKYSVYKTLFLTIHERRKKEQVNNACDWLTKDLLHLSDFSIVKFVIFRSARQDEMETREKKFLYQMNIIYCIKAIFIKPCQNALYYLQYYMFSCKLSYNFRNFRNIWQLYLHGSLETMWMDCKWSWRHRREDRARDRERKESGEWKKNGAS